MSLEFESLMKKILSILVNETASEIGDVLLDIPFYKTVRCSHLAEFPLLEEQWGEIRRKLQSHDGNPQACLLDLQDDSSFELLLAHGIRYAWLIPCYQQNQYIGYAFLASSSAYGVDTGHELTEKVRFLFQILAQMVHPGPADSVQTQLLNELKSAQANQELSLVYQPKVDIKTGGITGSEALLRWNNPALGFVSPAEFIPLAEESGLIVPIGKWVLQTACAQTKAWQAEGMKPIYISVNLSPRQLEQPDFVEVVRGILQETGLESRFLELEITEGMTMDVGRVLPVLTRLKELGIRISMDDFGIGYSSLYHLKRLPIDTIKIDRSFVQDCTTDSNDGTIVKTIITMAHHFGLNVIAEGVENDEQLAFLQQHDCDEVQGYLFSKPVPAGEIPDRLSAVRDQVRRYGWGRAETGTEPEN